MEMFRSEKSDAREEIYAHLTFRISELCKKLEIKKWALLDWPAHSNCGDSAIWLGTLTEIERHFQIRPAYVTRESEYPEDLEKLMLEGPVFLLGGGNFGDTWKRIHDNRLRIIRDFRNRQIIQLPQSINFSSDEYLKETVRAIRNHPDFILLVRDAVSFEFAKKNFECEIHLCPDMAYGMKKSWKLSEPSTPALCLLRSDHEKSETTPSSEFLSRYGQVTDWEENFNERKFLLKILNKSNRLLGTRSMTMRHLERYFRVSALEKVQRGIDTLSCGNVVITDRLHGHILSSLIGKPHVVFDNSYGKVVNFIETWPRDEFTRIALSSQDLEGYMTSLRS